MTKITQIWISLPPKVYKLWNRLEEIPFIYGFPTLPKACHNFPKICSLDIIELFFIELFNIQ
jgi:hypothetical protein